MSVTPPFDPGHAATMAHTYAVASIGRRFAAWIIDLIGLAVIAFIAGVVLGLTRSTTVTFPGSNGATLTNTTFWLPTEWASALLLAASAVYSIPLWRVAHATLGQRLVGLRVFAVAGATPLGWGRAVVRWAILFGWVVAGIASATLVALLWLLVLLITAWRDPQRRGLHDRYAQSIVVRRQGYITAPGMPMAPAPPGANRT